MIELKVKNKRTLGERYCLGEKMPCLVFQIYFNHNNVLVRSVTCLSCGVEGECLALGPGMEHFSGVSSVEECQDLCWQRRQTCNYFTYYNQSANQGEQ